MKSEINFTFFKMMKNLRFLVVVFLSLTHCLSVPGLIPNQFNKDSQLDVYVSRLNSIKTLLPFDFYYLNYCNPSDVEYKTENVGEALTGDHIANTPFKVTYNLSKLIVQNDEKR